MLVKAEKTTIYSEATVTVRTNSRIRYTSTLPHVRGLSCPSQGSARISNGTRAASRSGRSRVSSMLLSACDAITPAKDAERSVQPSDEAYRPT